MIKTAIYRNIQMSFWTDTKVEDDFTPEDKYFYLYLLTNPHTNLCGCYEISYKQMSNETGYNKDTIERLIARFEEVHNIIRYSKTTKEMFIMNWSKYNWQGGNQKPCLEKEIKDIKDSVFREEVNDIYKGKFGKKDTPLQGAYKPLPSNLLEATVTVTDTDSFNIKNNNIKNYIYILTTDYKNVEYIKNNKRLDAGIREWLSYKDEKTPKKDNHYDSRRSMESLLTQIVNNDMEYGTDVVLSLIEVSITNGWKGIFFEQAYKYKGKEYKGDIGKVEETAEPTKAIKEDY